MRGQRSLPGFKTDYAATVIKTAQCWWKDTDVD